MTMNIFSDDGTNVTKVSVGDNSQLAFISLSVPNEVDVEGQQFAVITQFNLQKKENYSIANALDDQVYLFTSSRKLDFMTLGGIAFTSADCGESGEKQAGLQYVLDFYEKNRITANSTGSAPQVKIDILGGKKRITRYTGFLVGGAFSVSANAGYTASFNLQLLVTNRISV